MNIISYGAGIDSTALIIKCHLLGIKIDLILFADTGGEKPHTYQYLKMFSKWCVEKGLPEIIRVQQVNQYGTAITLEQICLNNHALPSLAYGFKSCSIKHKIAPQDKFVNNWAPARAHWKAGNKITKFIGYDTDESHRSEKDYSDKKYDFRYPLIEWDMSRDDCSDTIIEAGLSLPGKSACFFCPSSSESEIHELASSYPKLAARAIDMEANAHLTKVKGLGRNYAWSEVLKQDDLIGFDLPPDMACGCLD